MLAAFEVDQADFLFIAPTNTSSRDAPVVIAATGTLARLDQVLFGSGFGYVAVIRIRDIARGRRQRSKRLYWHKSIQFPSQLLGGRNHHSCPQTGGQLSAPQVMLFRPLPGENGAVNIATLKSDAIGFLKFFLVPEKR